MWPQINANACGGHNDQREHKTHIGIKDFPIIGESMILPSPTKRRTKTKQKRAILVYDPISIQ